MGREISFTVPIYANVNKTKKVLVAMNWYRNAHYIVSNNIKKFYRQVVHTELKGKRMTLVGRLHINYEIYIGRRGTDGGNVRSVIEKFVLDALKKEGIIRDDSFEDIVSDSSQYFLDRDNSRADITIKELDYGDDNHGT